MERPEPSATRVLVVGGRRAFTEALAETIARRPGLAAEALTAASDAERSLADRPADVALVDVTGADAAGAADALPRLRRAAPTIRILALIDGADEAGGPIADHLRVARGDGVVSSAEPVERIIDAIVQAAASEAAATGFAAPTGSRGDRRRRAPHAGERQRSDRLTPRERQILQLMADGLEPPEIASRLRVRPATLRTHVQNILTKLGVHSKTQAVLLALRQGAVRARSV